MTVGRYWRGIDLASFAPSATAITSSAVVADHKLVRGHGGARIVQDSAITCDDAGNLSGVGTVGCGTITTTGNIVLSTAGATVDGRDLTVDGAYLDLIDDYWRISGGVVNNSGSLAAYTDDLVFGSPQLADDGNAAHDNRMGFDKGQGSLSAGTATSTQWDTRGDCSVRLGYNATASGDYAFAFNTSTVTGSISVGFGNSVLVSDNYAFASGRGCCAVNTGEFARSGGYQNAIYDSYYTLQNWTNVTTDATANVELWVNGPTNSKRQAIPSDCTLGFTIWVVARRTDSDGESYFAKHEGCIDNNAGTVAVVGAVSTTVIADDSGGAWASQVTADDANNAIKVDVTGAVGKTIIWHAFGFLGRAKG